jgi:hypothetical protein
MALPARLDLPPPAAARRALPAAFGRRFAIFADAEEEFDWSAPFRRDATATTAIAALPHANARFVASGCVPTHMIDWPVIDTPASAAIMQALYADGLCEVGAQLHPWVNPPFEEPVTSFNSYLGNLPPALQRAKLQALTTRIETLFGTRPQSYRAGRYGIGPDTAVMLAECGYRLDCSVRANFDYRAQHGPDFSAHPVWPWRVSDQLNALPLTSIFTGALRRWPRLHRARALQGILARGHLLNRIPLTPEGVSLSDALAAIDRLVADDHRLFSLSFHTPSLVPGHTPYVRDAADLKRFWTWWDGVFNRFAVHGVTGIRCSEIVAALGTG